ncbi:MAG: hypothetical protein U0136_12305 [Bdellovibrionota bacterium]
MSTPPLAILSHLSVPAAIYAAFLKRKFPDAPIKFGEELIDFANGLRSFETGHRLALLFVGDNEAEAFVEACVTSGRRHYEFDFGRALFAAMTAAGHSLTYVATNHPHAWGTLQFDSQDVPCDPKVPYYLHEELFRKDSATVGGGIGHLADGPLETFDFRLLQLAALEEQKFVTEPGTELDILLAFYHGFRESPALKASLCAELETAVERLARTERPLRPERCAEIAEALRQRDSTVRLASALRSVGPGLYQLPLESPSWDQPGATNVITFINWLRANRPDCRVLLTHATNPSSGERVALVQAVEVDFPHSLSDVFEDESEVCFPRAVCATKKAVRLVSTDLSVPAKRLLPLMGS